MKNVIKQNIETLSDKIPLSWHKPIRKASYIGIVICFFFIWSNIISETQRHLHPLFLMSVGLIVPFYLLYAILKKKNPFAYLTVVAIMFFNLLLEFLDFIFYFSKHLFKKEEEGLLGLINLHDYIPIYEAHKSAEIMLLSCLTILLLTSTFIGERFGWKKEKFVKAILGALLLFSFLYLHKFLVFIGLY